MMDVLSTPSILALVIGVLIILYNLTKGKSKYRYPPGPREWPFVGNVFSFDGRHLHEELHKVMSRYGDIMTFNVLGERMVVLNSSKAIREVLGKDELANVVASRPVGFLDKYTMKDDLMFMQSGDKLEKMRKTFHGTLRMYGEGVEAKNTIVLEELSNMISWMEKQNGQAFDPKDILQRSLCNIVTILLIGERFEYDDASVKIPMDFVQSIDNAFVRKVEIFLYYFPFMRHFPSLSDAARIYQDLLTKMADYLDLYLTKQKETFDSVRRRGMVDELLDIQTRPCKEGKQPWMSDDNLKGLLKDVTVAGILTTRATIYLTLLVLLHKPEIARKIQAEVDEVIGQNRPPRLADRPDMHYTQAVMLEVLRFNSAVKLSMPHMTTADITIRDWIIPKGTTLMPNLWAAHYDEKTWDRPQEFLPDRFLDEDGHVLRPDHPTRRNMVAFSLGRRKCPGAIFAKTRVFLFITSLLQKFDFKPEEGVPLQPLDTRGWPPCDILIPLPYKLRALPRDL